MIDIQGVTWHGTTTRDSAQMVRFCEDVMGLSACKVEQADITRFEFANGDAFVVLPAPPPGESSVYDGLAFGFLVPDVQAAYDEMSARGAQFIGPVHRGNEHTWASAWAHFRAPDGHVYALVSRPSAA